MNLLKTAEIGVMYLYHWIEIQKPFSIKSTIYEIPRAKIFTPTENDPPAGGWGFHVTFKKQNIFI
jgi:hypothetical protein